MIPDMEILTTIGRLLLRLLVTMLIISTIVFLLLRLLPGDPAQVIAGIDAKSQDIERIRNSLGMNGSAVRQYFVWLGDIMRFDFGNSYFSGRPVSALILERLPVTANLALLAMVFTILTAIPIGVLSAVKRWSFWDALGLLYSQLGMALPSFWMGILLLLLFSVKLGWFPLFGAQDFRALVLPAISLGLSKSAVLVRITRISMIEELGKPYIEAARAKGLVEHRIQYVHALQNALLPVLTVTGLQLGGLLGGAIIIEQIFSLPGLGRLFLTGIYQRDFAVVQGSVIFMAFLFSIINFLVDLLYTLINPKARITG
jgi:peptide/nickel transport system permease protein